MNRAAVLQRDSEIPIQSALPQDTQSEERKRSRPVLPRAVSAGHVQNDVDPSDPFDSGGLSTKGQEHVQMYVPLPRFTTKWLAPDNKASRQNSYRCNGRQLTQRGRKPLLPQHSRVKTLSKTVVQFARKRYFPGLSTFFPSKVTPALPAHPT